MAEYGGRIASVVDARGRTGYLMVREWHGVDEVSGERAPSVDLALVIRSEDGEWEYSDRADPADYDTGAELERGVVDWYGQPLSLTWLSVDRAAAIEAEHFAG
ncbi:hypothetical protein ALI22I_32465 [Saccharothrix sp. ALI-22-I]|uniref:hypothetical protein n=1 Tax=Saccharothrix sp. ALI-22-I TaxID=1933778 RepID=UPI00097BE35C|nr:hypothetical protein [Saccharothrix sp. ALI-22-I]ONI83264.1 hypothetical protein ALI22I_32465 [Saccharothrix sp. ALI-22-I]